MACRLERFWPVRGRVARRESRTCLGDVVILVAWQGMLISGLTASIGWWAWPVLWVAPVYCFTYLMDNLRTFAEHSHPEKDTTADAHRLIHYDGTFLERVFIAPLGMNHHASHHLWPSIPYYNLPLATAAIRGRPEADGIVWRGSYVAYLFRYWRALPIVECRRPAPNDGP